MKKRILSIILAAALCVGLAPQPARAGARPDRLYCPMCDIDVTYRGEYIDGNFCRAKCATCGWNLDAIYPHSGGNATCQQQAVCSLCNTSYGALGEHDFTKYVSSENGTHQVKCSRDGCNAVKDSAEACTRRNDNCIIESICKLCNGTIPVASGHDFTKYVSQGNGTHQAQCSRDGCTVMQEGKIPSCEYVDHDHNCTTPKQCQFCQYEDPSDIPAPFHNHTSPNRYASNGDNATHRIVCNNAGCNVALSGFEEIDCSGGNATCQQKAVCSDCNTPYGALGEHQTTSHSAKAATCTEVGWDAYEACTVSGCTYKRKLQ